jgi:hypothetical protein
MSDMPMTPDEEYEFYARLMRLGGAVLRPAVAGAAPCKPLMEARDIADWPYPAELARALAAAQGRMSG